MKTIEEVKHFLEEFVAEEYKVNISKIDQSVSQDEHEKRVVDFFNKFYSSFYGWLNIGGELYRSFDEMYEKLNQSNLKTYLRREIYLIKQYKKTRFGKGILSDAKEMFSCYIGPTKNPRNFDRYHDNFIITVYQGELKIVSKRTLDYEYKGDKLNWGYDKRSVEKADGMTVLNNGELVDVLRLREPDDEFWIKDYYEEN